MTVFEKLREPERAKNAKPETAVLTTSFGKHWSDPLKQALSSVNLTPFNDFLVFDGVGIRIKSAAKFTSFSISFVAGIFEEFVHVEQAIQEVATQIIACTEDDKTYLHNFTNFLSAPPYNKEGLVE
jgi:serine/threonine protein phosphatase PrpC